MVDRRLAIGYRLLLSFAAAFASLIASAAEPPWRVVILNATDANLPAFVTLDRATRAVLTAPGAHPVEIYAETLDMTRFPAENLEPEVLALLRKKYAARSVDAVIAVATPALDFAERHRDVLWPAATIVFHSVPADTLRGRRLLPWTSGIPLDFDFARSVDLALRLRPTTRQVVVIAGSAAFDRRLATMAKSQLSTFASRVAVDFWTERGIDDLVAGVARLPPTAAVLYLSMYRDAGGRVFVPRDVLARLAAASPAPIFGAFDTYVGSGMVAGWADDTAARGARAAQLVQAALAAPAGSPLPAPVSMAPVCLADARALSRFEISGDLLPDGCTALFGEPSVWQRYRWQIVTGLAIIASQSLLIVALILQRRRRRRAELDSQAARTELAHAARLTSMGELTASIAHEVKQPLSAILAHAETAEILLESDAPPIAEIQRIVTEIRRDDLRASDVITRLRELLGKHDMDERPLDLNGTIRDTLQLLEVETARRRVTLESELEPGLPSVVGDRVHLQQVVLNLVLNAMDAVCSVAVGTRRVVIRTTSAAEWLEVSVADNGPGIAPAIASRLFDSFATTKHGGLGLGLSIARTIVEAHGGHITAAAGVDGGAVFRVVLPSARQGAQAVDPPLAPAPLAGVT